MTSRPALLLILLLTGCSVGLRVNRFAPAQRPAGVIGRLEVAHVGSFDAELLAVDDTSLRMLEGTELIRVPLRLIRRARFAQFGNLCDWKAPASTDCGSSAGFPGESPRP